MRHTTLYTVTLVMCGLIIGFAWGCLVMYHVLVGVKGQLMEEVRQELSCLRNTDGLSEEKPVGPVLTSVARHPIEMSVIPRLRFEDERATYAQQFAHVAQQEMDKFGIPASITLAQGILESGSGSSDLARKANNHFGIKYYGKGKIPLSLHENVVGHMGLHDDCCDGSDCKNPDKFCKYDIRWASFRHHSLLLKNMGRYSRLFALPKSDYKAWARGLQDCGYATSKSYARKLINLIEDLKLYEYDQDQ